MNEWMVVDTNAVLTAEGKSSYSRKCQAECARVLLQIQRQHIVVLDSGREILTEYRQQFAAMKGQPGAGFEFWKWLLNASRNQQSCEYVTLTTHEERGYVEFPDHPGLENFDPSDRKFVAVANQHPERPHIVQATDSKWIGWRRALGECGIELVLPCEKELKAKWEAKGGQRLG